MDAREKADLLRGLHAGPRILVLPNAWDVASARIFEAVGAHAVATTSAGVANSLGYPDGEAIPAEEMLAAVARIARAVSVPVTADLEAGYGDPAATAAGAIAAGAVGLNLEDGIGDDSKAALRPVEEQAAAVAAVRAAADRAGVPLVINARTDVFLRGIGPEAERVELAAARANAYLEAGADCAFLIGVTNADTIGELVGAVRGPVSVLARPGSPPVAELERLGVCRVSVGPYPMRATAALTQRIAEELLGPGTYASLGEPPYPDLNALLG